MTITFWDGIPKSILLYILFTYLFLYVNNLHYRDLDLLYAKQRMFSMILHKYMVHSLQEYGFLVHNLIN